MAKQRLMSLDSYLSAPRQPEITLAAAVRLRCLDCCANQRGEVARCTAYRCPLWSYRMGRRFEPVPPGLWAPDPDSEPKRGTVSTPTERGCSEACTGSADAVAR